MIIVQQIKNVSCKGHTSHQWPKEGSQCLTCEGTFLWTALSQKKYLFWYLLPTIVHQSLQVVNLVLGLSIWTDRFKTLLSSVHANLRWCAKLWPSTGIFEGACRGSKGSLWVRDSIRNASAKVKHGYSIVFWWLPTTKDHENKSVLHFFLYLRETLCNKKKSN